MCDAQCNAERCIVVDATGHVAGKLAAKVAKKLLEGYFVTIVCAENAVLTGPLERRVGKYMDWKNKRCVVNPERGAFHYKEPSAFLFKILRTMVQRKSNRGGEALAKLAIFESIPNEYLHSERYKFPEALKDVTTNPERKSTTIGMLLSKFGWKHVELSKKMTEQFRAREEAEKKQNAAELKKKTESADFKKKVDAEMSRLK